MKYPINVLILTILFGFISFLSGTTVEPVYGSIYVSFLFSGLLTSIITLAVVLPLMFLAGVLDYFIRVPAFAVTVGILLALMTSYYIVKLCGLHFGWYPTLSHWWIIAFVIVSTGIRFAVFGLPQTQIKE